MTRGQRVAVVQLLHHLVESNAFKTDIDKDIETVNLAVFLEGIPRYHMRDIVAGTKKLLATQKAMMGCNGGWFLH